MHKLLLATLLTLGTLAFAQSAPAPTVAADFAGTSGSTLRYKLVHKLHEVEGVSKQVVSRARVLSDGTVQVMARAPVASFDSGNGNRDEHMKEVVDAARFPFVEVKGLGHGFHLPTQFPATVQLPLELEVTFHGETHPVQTTANLTFSDANHAEGDTVFPISLDGFHVQRPELAFIKVNDAVTITVHLVLQQGAH